MGEGLRYLLSNLKHLGQTTLVNTVDRLATRRRPTVPGTLLLVHLDAIGDYVLLRNFIRELKTREKFRGFRVTFCGNIAYKSFAEWLDCEDVADFIWLDRNRFRFNTRYRFRMIRSISARGFAVAINPSYSRIYYWGDTVIRASLAPERIGSIGDLTNSKGWQKALSDRFYTRLLPAAGTSMFEFSRYQEFFENLLEERLSPVKPFIEPEKTASRPGLEGRYAVLFPGAGELFRQWGTENFARIARYLGDSYGLRVVVAGSPADQMLAREIIAHAGPEQIVDLTGKTELPELAGLIASAQLLVSNDTGAVHIAVAVNARVVCISNGNQFGRFLPYPKAVYAGASYVFPPGIRSDSGEFEALRAKYAIRSDLDINTVSVDAVKLQIDAALLQRREQTEK